MAMSDINREDVLAAVGVLNDPGQDELVRSLRFKDATRYRLVYLGRFYDSKAAIGVAHGLATGTYWTSDDFTGGINPGDAAYTLRQLGFFVDDGPLFDLTQINIDKTDADYAPNFLVLRWAIKRADVGTPRLSRFLDVKDELAELLLSHSIAKNQPDPAMPWLALSSSGWWELKAPPELTRLTAVEVRRLNINGGLTEDMYRRVSRDQAFAQSATAVLDRLIAGKTTSPPPPARHTPAPERGAILFTWNPDKWAWGKDYEDAAVTTALGSAVKDVWSTRRTRGVNIGDRAFLLKQGNQGRGLIASGTVVGGLVVEPHWDGSGEPQRKYPVNWDVVLWPDQLLPTDVLQETLPQQDWQPQGSGIAIKTDVLLQLEALWSQHLTSIPWPSGSGSGQGVATDPVRRKKIEDAAQDRLMQHYTDLGWDVVDTRAGNPFDAVATRGGATLYLEAKGTQSPGETIFLTHGEVQHARANNGQCVLGIWSSMQFDERDEIDRSAGNFRLLSFDPHDDHLTPTQYVYRPPGIGAPQVGL